MGTLKVKSDKKGLHMVYQMDHFEEMQPALLSGVACLEESDRRLACYFEQFETVVSFLKRGVSLNQLRYVLSGMVHIADMLEQQYVLLEDVLHYPEQFIIHTITKQVVFVHISVTGVLETLPIKTCVCRLLNTVHIEMQDKIEPLETLLATDFSIKSLRSWCESMGDYYALQVKQTNELIFLESSQTIGRSTFKSCQTDYVSQAHVSYVTKMDRQYVADLNALNGTFLNGDRLMPQHMYVLAAQDELTLADVVCRVVKISGSCR